MNTETISNVFSEEYEMYINRLAKFEKAVEIADKQTNFLKTLMVGERGDA